MRILPGRSINCSAAKVPSVAPAVHISGSPKRIAGASKNQKRRPPSEGARSHSHCGSERRFPRAIRRIPAAPPASAKKSGIQNPSLSLTNSLNHGCSQLHPYAYSYVSPGTRANDRAKSACDCASSADTPQSTGTAKAVLGKNGYPVKTIPRPIHGSTIAALRITPHTNCRFPTGVLRLSIHNFIAATVHPSDANTTLEILNVTASGKSAIVITSPMIRESLMPVPGSGGSPPKARKSIAAATRQTTLVGRSVLVPTILLVVAQIVPGTKRRVQNQSMGEVLSERKMRSAAGMMRANSAAIKKPSKRWCAKPRQGPWSSAANQRKTEELNPSCPIKLPRPGTSG